MAASQRRDVEGAARVDRHGAQGAAAETGYVERARDRSVRFGRRVGHVFGRPAQAVRRTLAPSARSPRDEHAR